MSNVIELPVIPRKAADRVALYVAPMQICDNYHGCGAEMRPVEK